ncbi:Gfo/Idh/MocA family protein [Aporhodopirellula aestuarii]|uniref:Gfo/Idh/MocA family oxidoreductase n=1 Tax=Aporhodopirellula aestuarii TaxID=2950107 RepID=A0ABT0UA95_9BACT|nr:Gfo/Idh/MocA family oxidoreductase [Aporhodopirellula aestuarii]MCM2373435.1 Gfo/Idh/MocA family oxidoreductase [Aporhodopirellula aestuarii]
MPKDTSQSVRRGPLSAHVDRASNRREFFTRSTMAFGSTVALGGSAAIAAGESLLAGPSAPPPTFHVSGRDTLRIGLIGCGARGRGAVIEAIQAASASCSAGKTNPLGQVQLVAMADTFANNLQTAYRAINGRHRANVDVGNRRFVGLDGWKGVLAADLDLVILSTPPAFRPLHFEAAVAAGKHIFMESPVATDIPGLRRVIAAGNVAQKRGLAVSVGLQRRYEARTRDCVDRLREGMIGELVSAHTYSSGFATGRSITANHERGLEEQIRNWHDFAWMSGGFVDERHLHNLDTIHWVLGQTPIAARKLTSPSDVTNVYTGGSPASNVKTANAGPAIEFAYENGVRTVCEHRNPRGTERQLGEWFQGSEGACDLSRAIIRNRDGKVVWQSDAKEIPGKGWQQQFNQLIGNLREGQMPADLNHGIACTATAILERMVTQSGQSLTWDRLMASDEGFHHPPCTA